MDISLFPLGYIAPLVLVLVVSSFRRLSSINKLFKYGLSSKGEDTSCQLFYFIKTLSQDSLCPSTKLDGNNAALFYPLGLYWLSINLAKRFCGQKPIHLTYEALASDKSYVNSALKICVYFNCLVFPFLFQLNIICIAFLIGTANTFSVISVALSLIIVDFFFNSVEYPVQTRSIGFYLTSQLLTLIVAYIHLPVYLLNTFSLDLSLYSIFNSSIAIIFFLIFTVVITSIFVLVTRSSQQGSQFSISIVVSILFLPTLENLSVLFPLKGLLIISLISSALIQQLYPWLDSTNFYISHLYNRLSESAWRFRTYGHSPYRIFEFLRKPTLSSSTYLKDMIRNLLCFNLQIGASSKMQSFLKHNIIFQIFQIRFYLYSALFLIIYYNSPYLEYNERFILNLICVVFAATVVPSILCCFKPFLGYGPPLHYIEYFAPFIILLSSLFTVQFFESLNFISAVFYFDLSLYLAFNSYSFLFRPRVLNIASSSQFNANLSTIYRMMGNSMYALFQKSKDLPFAEKSLKISCINGLYSMPLEASLLLHDKLNTSDKKSSGNILFPHLSSKNYGILDNWIFVYLMPKKFFTHEGNCVLIDFSNSKDVLWMKQLLKVGYSRTYNYKFLTNDLAFIIMK